MSGKNNVNPNHYKTGGRDRQGDNILHEQEKQEARRGEQERHDAGQRRNLIPGAPPAEDANPAEE